MFNKELFIFRLKTLREKNGVSTRKLGNAIGVSSPAISQFEKGIALPALDTLAALASFFGVSTDYLMGITDIPHPIPANLQEIINQSTDPAELLQALNRTSSKDDEKSENKIDALIKGLDEESMRELRKYIKFLHARQTLDDGEDESSAGSDSDEEKAGIN